MNGIYNVFFNLVNQYIFGGATLATTSYEHLMCVFVATVLSLVVVYAPFCVVRWFFRGIAR